MVNKIDNNYIKKVAEEISNTSMIPYEDLPRYDLFLSQVIDFLNDKFVEDKYTNNIVQNYIKSEVISKPEDGKKRGYTKIHLVQLVLLSYMRPIMKLMIDQMILLIGKLLISCFLKLKVKVLINI